MHSARGQEALHIDLFFDAASGSHKGKKENGDRGLGVICKTVWTIPGSLNYPSPGGDGRKRLHLPEAFAKAASTGLCPPPRPRTPPFKALRLCCGIGSFGRCEGSGRTRGLAIPVATKRLGGEGGGASPEAPPLYCVARSPLRSQSGLGERSGSLVRGRSLERIRARRSLERIRAPGFLARGRGCAPRQSISPGEAETAGAGSSAPTPSRGPVSFYAGAESASRALSGETGGWRRRGRGKDRRRGRQGAPLRAQVSPGDAAPGSERCDARWVPSQPREGLPFSTPSPILGIEGAAAWHGFP